MAKLLKTPETQVSYLCDPERLLDLNLLVILVWLHNKPPEINPLTGVHLGGHNQLSQLSERGKSSHDAYDQINPNTHIRHSTNTNALPRRPNINS